MPLFMKIPIRGFNNARFRRAFDVVNLAQLNAMFDDGETVNLQTLRERGFISGHSYGIKVLGSGELTKKLKIQVDALSDGAREKLTIAKIPYDVES